MFAALCMEFDQVISNETLCREQAFTESLKAAGQALPSGDVFSKFQHLLKANEHQLLLLGGERFFKNTFAAVLPNAPAQALSQLYLQAYAEQVEIHPYAEQVVASLAQYLPLYMVSNGLTQVQHCRIHASGLAPYFEKLVISGDTGVAKPRREIFDLALTNISVCRSHVLHIGTSLTLDGTGAHNAGLQFCFLNRTGMANNADYEIRSLRQLFELSDYIATVNGDLRSG